MPRDAALIVVSSKSSAALDSRAPAAAISDTDDAPDAPDAVLAATAAGGSGGDTPLGGPCGGGAVSSDSPRSEAEAEAEAGTEAEAEAGAEAAREEGSRTDAARRRLPAVAGRA